MLIVDGEELRQGEVRKARRRDQVGRLRGKSKPEHALPFICISFGSDQARRDTLRSAVRHHLQHRPQPCPALGIHVA
jgi:hypothetical protein